MAGVWTPPSTLPTILPNAYVGVPYLQNIFYQPQGSFVDWMQNIAYEGCPGALPWSWTGTGTQIFVDVNLPALPGDIKPFVATCTFTSIGVNTFTLNLFDGVVPSCETLIQSVQFVVNVLPNPNTKKRKRLSAPETFCCKPEQFKNNVCPPELRTTSGFRYVNIGNGCYIKVKNR